MDRIAVRLVIRGRVQGVGYRWWAREAARRLGLDGWVRNRADGSVELVAAGLPDKLAQLEALCRRGPSSAHVAEVERGHAEGSEIPTGFEARATA